MLLVGIAPDGADFAQGGRASASAVLPLSTAGTQTFSVRALIANNPQSLTYQIAARLLPGSTANIVCDGVPLSTSDSVIAREVSYDAMQSHSIEVVGGDATAIVLTVRPN